VSDLVLVGRVVKAHGLRGAVIVRPASDGSDVLLRVRTVQLGPADQTRACRVWRAQWQGRQLMLTLDGVADRNAAEAMVGTELWLDRRKMPPPDDDEFYVAALVGLPVVDRSTGHAYGAVVGVESSPVQHWLQVQTSGSTVLVPLTDGLVQVDREAGCIRVNAPEGLFDPLDGAGG